MTREEALALVNNHNEEIREFMECELPALLGVKSKYSKIDIYQWFEAQRLIEAKDFYKAGKALQDQLRADGWDIKMNMQSYELVWYGRLA